MRGLTMKDAVTDRAIVHIIDDDESMRAALERMFHLADLDTRAYGTAREFLDAKLPEATGCIVLDVRLPGINGLELQRQLGDIGCRLPIVLITSHADIPMSVQAMKAGAVDFLPKPFRSEDMLGAVAAAIESDRKRIAVEKEIADIQSRFASLTPREQQVMLLVARGKINKQVAAELNISQVTVKIHRGAAMRKMGARTYADLVRMADFLLGGDNLQAADNT
jgi:FixJ family two-component response regulator